MARAALGAVILLAAIVASSAVRGDVATPAARPAQQWAAPLVALTSYPLEDGRTYLIFALYQDGHVLYPAPLDYTFENYLTTTLTKAEAEALVHSLPLGRVGKLKPPQRSGDVLGPRFNYGPRG